MKKIILLLIMTVFAFSQESLKFKANIFFDAYYSGNHDPAVDQASGMWIRRIYLTADNNFSDSFSARVRLELTGNDFNDVSAKLSPVLKDMYIKWKSSDSFQLLFGIQSNPSVGIFEDYYGMRHIEKTPSDMYGIESTRDMGFGLETKISDNLSYNALIGNGDSNNNESVYTDPTTMKTKSLKGKIFSNAFTYDDQTYFIQLAGHFNNTLSDNNNLTFHTILGFKNESFHAGFSFDFMENEFRPTETKTDTRIASLFFRKFMDDNYFFFRADRSFTGIAKSPAYYNIAPGSKFNLFLAGYQFQVEKNISISPNFTLITYDTDGIDSDYLFRLTFAMKW